MSTMAFRVASHGPRGFSFASITTAPGWYTARSSAARDASVVMRNAIAAVAAADNWRNARRDPLRSVLLPFIGSSWRDEIAGGKGGAIDLDSHERVRQATFDWIAFAHTIYPALHQHCTVP